MRTGELRRVSDHSEAGARAQSVGKRVRVEGRLGRLVSMPHECSSVLSTHSRWRVVIVLATLMCTKGCDSERQCLGYWLFLSLTHCATSAVSSTAVSSGSVGVNFTLGDARSFFLGGGTSNSSVGFNVKF